MDITIPEQEFSRASQGQGHNQKHDRVQEILETKLMRGDIPHVLEQIASFLPVESLKQCRLINTYWNKVATLQMQQNIQELRFSNKVKKIQSFLDLVSNSKVTPFVKFNIRLGDIKSKTLLDSLFRTIAPVATHLTIRIDISGVGHTLDFNISKQLQFPSLTSVILTVRKRDSLEVSSGPVMSKEKLQQKIGALIRTLEKMRLLKSVEWDIETGTGLLNRRVLKRLIKILEWKTNGELRHLSVNCPGIKDCHFERLANLGLRLTSFSLRSFVDSCSNYEINGRGGNGSSGLMTFLMDQSNSLVELDLKWIVGLFDRLEFPRLEKLTSLRVQGWRPLINRSLEIRVTPSMNYSRFAPALKKIDLDIFDYEEWFYFLPVTTFLPVLSVERLYLPTEIGDESDDCIQHAVKYFPNLKVLRLPANLSFVNIVYKSLPKLEELILSVDHVKSIDDVITGFTLEHLRSLLHLGKAKFFREIKKLSLTMKEREQNLAESSLWPLSTLKNLKILRIESANMDMKLSRISAQLVFSKMPNLHTIDLGHVLAATEIEQELLKDVIDDLKQSGKTVIYK